MRISIIGSGFIAATHAAIIKSLGHDLVAIISRNHLSATQFAEKWSIPFAGTDIETAIEKSDCIHICTPPLAHFEYAKKAILAGKHLICEKPLTIAANQAKMLMDLAEKKQVVAAVNFNVRYHEACLRAKNIIAQESFGQIQLIHGSYLQEFHATSDFYSWRYKADEGGPMRATTEIGSHWIDLARYWTGLEIEAISANFTNFNPKRYLTPDNLLHSSVQTPAKTVAVNSEDVATLVLKFSNGAIGNVVLSEVAHGRKNQLQLEVSGSNQSVWWNNEKPYQLYTGKKNQGIQTQVNPFGDGFSATFKGLFAAVYEAIENQNLRQKPNYPTFEDGYINAKICEAAYQSAIAKGIWVTI